MFPSLDCVISSFAWGRFLPFPLPIQFLVSNPSYIISGNLQLNCLTKVKFIHMAFRIGSCLFLLEKFKAGSYFTSALEKWYKLSPNSPMHCCLVAPTMLFKKDKKILQGNTSCRLKWESFPCCPTQYQKEALEINMCP